MISDILISIPMRLLAASNWQNLEKASPTDSTADVATIGSLVTVFSNVIQAVTALAGIILFVMLVIGGYTFLFSGGDQKKLEKAKGTLTGAIIGLVILVSSYLILMLIQKATGTTADLTKFQLNIGQ